MQFTDEDLIRWLQAFGHINGQTIKSWESHKKAVRQKEHERLCERSEHSLCCVCDNPGYPYCPAHEV